MIKLDSLLDVSGCTVKCGPWQIENIMDSQYYVVFVLVYPGRTIGYWIISLIVLIDDICFIELIT